MSSFFSLTIRLLLAGALFSSCSHPSATTDSTSTSNLKVPTITSNRVSRADSLNGIPGHHFGEALSAFPGLVLTPGQGVPGTKRYAYPASKPETGWFGKHKKEVEYVFYTFRDDKFIAFQAVAFGAGRQALQKEAEYLFGKGERRGLGTHWAGNKAQAFYSLRNLPTGAAELLDVISVEDADTQAAPVGRLRSE
jgi:hypothetical protein